MERSKGSIHAFSSMDHVTTTSFSSTLSYLVSRSLLSLARSRVSFFRRASFLFSILYLSLSLMLAFLSFLPSTRSSQCTGDVTSTRISQRKKKKDREHGLPPDPNSATSPRYFRSPAFQRAPCSRRNKKKKSMFLFNYRQIPCLQTHEIYRRYTTMDLHDGCISFGKDGQR